MRYCIVIDDKIKKECSNLKSAKLEHEKMQEKLNKQFQKKSAKNKSNVKTKPVTAKLVQIPELSIGLKIYTHEDCENGEIRFVGEVINETASLFFTIKNNDKKFSVPWLKENFEQKYFEGIFVVGEDE